MGWDGYPGKSPQAALRAHLDDVEVIERTGITWEGGGRGHVWLLVKSWRTGEPVILQVIIDGHFFKDVDESMGPLRYDVPVSWLDRAPRAPGPFAEGFREKVYGFWAEREREAAKREVRA